MILRFIVWTYNYPLRTAQGIFNLLFHQYKKWRFVQKHDLDDMIFRRFSWGWGDTNHSLQVFIQPPWVLSDHDLRLFTKRTSVSRTISWSFIRAYRSSFLDKFPPYEANRSTVTLDSELRIWAKVRSIPHPA